MRKIIEGCPSCGGDLVVKELQCVRCKTEVRGTFAPGPFYRLQQDELDLLEVFVICRGNLKEMERELGTNYYVIRNKLNDVVQKLGYELNQEMEEQIRDTKQSILKALERGEITVTEAEEKLAELRQSGLR